MYRVFKVEKISGNNGWMCAKATVSFDSKTKTQVCYDYENGNLILYEWYNLNKEQTKMLQEELPTYFEKIKDDSCV